MSNKGRMNATRTMKRNSVKQERQRRDKAMRVAVQEMHTDLQAETEDLAQAAREDEAGDAADASVFSK